MATSRKDIKMDIAKISEIIEDDSGKYSFAMLVQVVGFLYEVADLTKVDDKANEVIGDLIDSTINNVLPNIYESKDEWEEHWDTINCDWGEYNITTGAEA